MVCFAEIVQVNGDHLLVAQLTPQRQTLLEPLHRPRHVSVDMASSPRRFSAWASPVLGHQPAEKRAEGLLELRLRTRIVAFELSNQAEALERASNAGRVSRSRPGVQAFLVAGASRLQIIPLPRNLAQTSKRPRDSRHVA